MSAAVTLNSALASFVRSNARRELKPLILEAKKRTAEHRRAIAELKRQVAFLTKELKRTQTRLPEPVAPAALESDTCKFRMRFDGLKNHRKRLGLSAADFGKLIGVSGLTIYNWEAGKSKPRRKHLPHIAQVRQFGKRDAMEALQALQPTDRQRRKDA